MYQMWAYLDALNAVLHHAGFNIPDYHSFSLHLIKHRSLDSHNPYNLLYLYNRSQFYHNVVANYRTHGNVCG